MNGRRCYAQDTRQLVVGDVAEAGRSLRILTCKRGVAGQSNRGQGDGGDRSARSRRIVSAQQLDRYRATPIRGRLQKNINLLSLEGQPAPALTANEHLGAPMPNLKGHRPSCFSGAHWCSDCKTEAPIIAALESAYRDRGLLVVGPTRRIRICGGGEDATPAEELAHIEKVRQRSYGMIRNMAVPVSNVDALGYGMDATPTLVLVDRAGKVALYHPGLDARRARAAGGEARGDRA